MLKEFKKKRLQKVMVISEKSRNFFGAIMKGLKKMARLDLAAYLATMRKFMRYKNMTKLADILLYSIAGPINLKITKGKHKGEEYTISSGRASELFNRKANPPGQIVENTDNPKVLATINDYFDSIVIDLLKIDSLDMVRDELVKLIEEDMDIPRSTKKELLEESKSKNLSSFLAKVFLYTLHVDNHGKVKKQLESIKDVPLSSVSFDRKDCKLHINYLEIPVPRSIAPDKIKKEELKYLNELCNAYSDKLKTTINIENISTCPKKRFRRDFNDERNYYNSIQSIIRGIREVFANVDEEYDILKNEAYEGIKETYFDDYPDGYKRLMEVFKKITNTSLSISQLVKLDIIGNSEKKGLCHVLVNEGYINSWVDVDE